MTSSGNKQPSQRNRRQAPMALWIGISIGLVLGVVLVGMTPALAAEVRDGEGAGDIYHLPAGEVINDDLYVAAAEILIDGIVEGDLVAAGGYIELNGEVTGDVILAGGGVAINGTVGDDARLAGGGVTVAGAIGDDLFLAGGGPGWPGLPAIPMRIGERTLAQGVQVTRGATIGGDAYVAGGQGLIDGAITGDLFSGMGRVTLGGTVGGDAQLYGETVVVNDSAQVAGNLHYGSGEPATIPVGVAASVTAETPQPVEPDTAANLWVWWLLSWLWRTVLLAIGFALLAWLIWRLAPALVQTTGRALRARPVEAALYGLLAVAFFLPVVVAATIIAGIFWGFPGALSAASLLFGLLGLLWIISPLFTGYWLGRLLNARNVVQGELAALLVGVLTIVLVARLFNLIPLVGALAAGLLYLLSLSLTIGGLILARRQSNVMVY
jgi:hypothetical protein